MSTDISIHHFPGAWQPIPELGTPGPAKQYLAGPGCTSPLVLRQSFSAGQAMGGQASGLSSEGCPGYARGPLYGEKPSWPGFYPCQTAIDTDNNYEGKIRGLALQQPWRQYFLARFFRGLCGRRALLCLLVRQSGRAPDVGQLR
jgi:hypothetical protein